MAWGKQEILINTKGWLKDSEKLLIQAGVLFPGGSTQSSTDWAAKILESS